MLETATCYNPYLRLITPPLLVRFARGGETKARPSQLRALRSDEALTEKEKEELAKPFDPGDLIELVASVEIKHENPCNFRPA